MTRSGYWGMLLLVAAGAIVAGCGGPKRTAIPAPGTGSPGAPNARGDTIGLYIAERGAFFLTRTNGDIDNADSFSFGKPGDNAIAVAGDWNGDGETTVGLYDPAIGRFTLSDESPAKKASATFGFKVSDAGKLAPIAGDWDGDGKAGVGLYSRKLGQFLLRNSLTSGGAEMTVRYGWKNTECIPIAGDWDGDGKAGVGLYDPKTAAFFLCSNLAKPDTTARFGYGPINAGALPVIGDWDGDGKAGIGVYVPKTGRFAVRNELSSGRDDATGPLGGPVSGPVYPIAGRWRAD